MKLNPQMKPRISRMGTDDQLLERFLGFTSQVNELIETLLIQTSVSVRSVSSVVRLNRAFSNEVGQLADTI